MQRTIWIYGLIIGTIFSVVMVITIGQLHSGADFEGNEIIGYAAMIIVFSIIYVGVRSYRNNMLDGHITFKRAFRLGAYIALIASSVYVAAWLFYYYLFIPDFMEKYTEYVLNQMKQSGAAEAAIAKKTENMERFSRMYKNPVFVVLVSYAEILPVGLVVSLVSALLVKRKPDHV